MLSLDMKYSMLNLLYDLKSRAKLR